MLISSELIFYAGLFFFSLWLIGLTASYYLFAVRTRTTNEEILKTLKLFAKQVNDAKIDINNMLQQKIDDIGHQLSNQVSLHANSLNDTQEVLKQILITSLQIKKIADNSLAMAEKEIIMLKNINKRMEKKIKS